VELISCGIVDFMTAKILNLKNPDTYTENIKVAANALLSGKIVAFPTETVYGLGVCADNDIAIDNLYSVKQRSRDKKLSIMISESEEVSKYVKNVPLIAEKLISTFWPGPLTIILNLDDNSTVGLRNPDNRVIRDLINEVAVPIASTSANISGGSPAIDAQQVINNFSDKIDVVLDGGPAEAGSPSTIVKIWDDTYEIIRHGVIGKERLNRCLNEDCFSIRS
jgi:L-threonylcarbamoyladenylate synthase